MLYSESKVSVSFIYAWCRAKICPEFQKMTHKSSPRYRPLLSSASLCTPGEGQGVYVCGRRGGECPRFGPGSEGMGLSNGHVKTGHKGAMSKRFEVKEDLLQSHSNSTKKNFMWSWCMSANLTPTKSSVTKDDEDDCMAAMLQLKPQTGRKPRRNVTVGVVTLRGFC